MRVSKLRIHDSSHAALRARGKVSLLTISNQDFFNWKLHLSVSQHRSVSIKM